MEGRPLGSQLSRGGALNTLLTVFFQKTIMRSLSLLVRQGREDHPGVQVGPQADQTPSTKRYNLPSRDGLRGAGSQTFSTVIGDGAVNNGSTINAFPCIEHEKKIGEPF